jgi:hypothetical protein
VFPVEMMVVTAELAGFKVHPAADLFPMLDDDALTALSVDIKEHGQLEPIWMIEGMILDGRNRLVACRRAGVEPRFAEWKQQANTSPVSTVISLNLHRRHLSASQRAAIAVDMEPLFAEEAHERMVAGASKGGTVSSARRRGVEPPPFAPAKTDTKPAANPSEAKPAPPTLTNPFGVTKTLAEQAAETGEPAQSFSGSGRAREQAAKAMSVSTGYVAQAKQVAREAPELHEKVRSGEITLTAARKILIDPAGLTGAKKEPAKKPQRVLARPKNSKVTSTRVNLELTITFGSLVRAQEFIDEIDGDPRIIRMDHKVLD